MATNAIQNTAPTSSQAPQQSGNLLNQMSSGPAGILYTLSNELTAIYNQLQASYDEMTKAEAKVQQNTIDTAATAQIAAAHKQAMGIWSQAVGSGIGALLTIGGFGAKYFGNGGLSDLNGQVEEQNTTLQSMTETKKLLPPQRNLVVADAERDQAAVNLRANNMKEGIYTQLGDETKTPEELERLRQDAVNTMSVDEHNNMIKDLDKKIPRAEKKLNELYTRMQYSEQKIDQYVTLANSGVNSISQGFNAVYTGQAGEASATQQVASGMTQMASSTGEATRQNIASNYSKVSEAINAASQGAKAYAQT